MKEETRRLAFEVGLTDDYIQDKVEEILKIAKEKKIDFSGPTLVGYDVQGPQVRVIDANFSPLINLQKAILAIYPSPKVYKAIISGWDLITLRLFRDIRLGLKEMGLIGERGSVFEDEGKIYRIHPIPEREHYKLKQGIFIAAAKAGLKIAFQGNLSNRVVCLYCEGDEQDRGDIRNHFLVKGTDTQTTELYELIQNKLNFEFDGERIKFKPTLENIKELDLILGRVRPLTSVRLSWEGKQISLTRDNLVDDRTFKLEDMEDFVEAVVPKGWEIDPNPDFNVDLIYRGDGFSSSKEEAANLLAKRKFGTDKYLIVNVGDKEGDVLEGGNTIFFPLIGTKADKYCKSHEIPHVSVINAVDYSLVLAEILNEEPSVLDLEIEDVLLRANSRSKKK